MAIEQYTTKTDLQAKLKLHRNTVSRLLATGHFPNAIKTGGRWRIPHEDVQAFIDGNRSRQEKGTGQ